MAGRRIRTGRVFAFFIVLLMIFSFFVMILPVPVEKSSVYIVSTEGAGERAFELAKAGLENVYSDYVVVYISDDTVFLPEKSEMQGKYPAEGFKEELIVVKKRLNADYVILITDGEIFSEGSTGSLLGQAFVYNGVAVVSYRRLENVLNTEDISLLRRDYEIMFKDTLVHEMGHLAGYKHSDDRCSVMYYALGPNYMRDEPATFNEAEEKELANRFVKSDFYRNKNHVFSFIAVLSFLALAAYHLRVKIFIVAGSMAFVAFPYILTLSDIDKRLEDVILNQFGFFAMLLIFVLSLTYLSIIHLKCYRMSLMKAMAAMFLAIMIFAVSFRIDAMIITYFVLLISLACSGARISFD